MKVCVLGPVHTPSYYGGVALFDEELAVGFAKNGCDVVIATNQKDARDVQFAENVYIRRYSKRGFREYLTLDKPDLIIASLGYAALLPRETSGCKVIYFLHGFFNERFYGKLKSTLAVIYQKHLISKVDYVFANSYFTKMINREFFGINVDKVQHLGVSDVFFDKLDEVSNVPKRMHSIFYAGKLVPPKGGRLLMEAMIILKNRGVDCNLWVAGDGPDLRWMQSMVQKHCLPVQFLGRISQADILNYYSQSEVFVSLCPTESFGITYVEALLNKCKIICPITGGQVEYLSGMQDQVAFVSEDDAEQIADGIQRLFNRNCISEISDEIKQAFRYANIAKEILYYVNHRGNEI